MKNKDFKNKQFSKLSEKKLKEGKQLNEMVIDLILDRQDGFKYTPEDFYRDAMMYGDVAHEITRAMDEGTEEDIKKALCKYVKDNKYNSKICAFINSVNWLEADLDEALVEPKAGESEQDYVSRFVGTKLATKEFPDQKQRLAVAYSKFRGAKGKKEEVVTETKSKDYTKGSKEYMTQIEKEAKKHGFKITFFQDLYPLKKNSDADLYNDIIAQLTLEKNPEIVVDVSADVESGSFFFQVSHSEEDENTDEFTSFALGYKDEDNLDRIFDFDTFHSAIKDVQEIIDSRETKENMEESKTMNVVKEKVAQKFTLANLKTTTWMDFYKETEGTSEEEIMSLYGDAIEDMKGKAGYSADVLLDGKKLFRLSCLLFRGMGEWTEYHIETQSITSLGQKLIDEVEFTAHSDEFDTYIEGVETPEFDENSTVDVMLKPFIKALENVKLKEAVEKDLDEVYVYQFPNSIQNFLPEFKRLCDEHNLTYLGEGYADFEDKMTENDFFVEGRLEDLEAMAKELEYGLHPDYLTPAEEFNREDILIESKKNKMKHTKKMIKEATQKQVDAMNDSFREKTKGKKPQEFTEQELVEYRELFARGMIISILAYSASPSFSDEKFNALFERAIKDRYLGDFLKPEIKYFNQPAISKERLKQIWDDMVKDFKKSEVGFAGEDSEGGSYNYVKYADESMKKPMKESLLKEGFKTEEATKFVKELTQKLFDDGAFFDLWVEDEEIKAQIEWGDWKHQHLYFKNKVQKFFDELDIEIDIESEVTEEDGSDAYSASYIITKK
jgi:hypothetical protein